MDDHRAHAPPRPGDVEEVVLAVHLEQLRTLGRQPDVRARRCAGILDQDLVQAPRLGPRNVCLEFGDAEGAAAGNHVGLAVVIEEQRMVVEHRLEGNRLPRPLLDVLGRINVGLAGGAGEGRDIVGALVVPQAARPRPFAVAALARGEVEFIDIVQGIVGVTDQPPVHEVGRFHDGHPGAHVHRGAAHVVVPAHADDRDVGHIGEDDRVAHGLRGRRQGGEQAPAGTQRKGMEEQSAGLHGGSRGWVGGGPGCRPTRPCSLPMARPGRPRKQKLKRLMQGAGPAGGTHGSGIDPLWSEWARVRARVEHVLATMTATMTMSTRRLWNRCIGRTRNKAAIAIANLVYNRVRFEQIARLDSCRWWDRRPPRPPQRQNPCNRQQQNQPCGKTNTRRRPAKPIARHTLLP